MLIVDKHHASSQLILALCSLIGFEVEIKLIEPNSSLPPVTLIHGPTSLTSLTEIWQHILQATLTQQVLNPANANNKFMNLALKHNLNIPSEELVDLSNQLTFKTFVLDTFHFTIHDLYLFVAIRSSLAAQDPSKLKNLIPLVRWFDHIQHLEGFEKSTIPVLDVTSALEVKAKSQPVAATTEQKSQAKNVIERPVEDPMRLDIRVGQIKRVWHLEGSDK